MKAYIVVEIDIHDPATYERYKGMAPASIAKYGVGALSPSQVETILRQTSDDLGKPGRDDFYGHGRVNAARAVGEQ